MDVYMHIYTYIKCHLHMYCATYISIYTNTHQVFIIRFLIFPTSQKISLLCVEIGKSPTYILLSISGHYL